MHITETFDKLKENLVLDENQRLMLENVPMLLIPRWFFAGIYQRVVEEVGPVAADSIYSQAGHVGAYKWCQVQIKKGLNGRAVLEQYLDSMSCRGWGQFEIQDFDQDLGRCSIRYKQSALAIELGQQGRSVCTWFCGALEGALQAISETAGRSAQYRASETTCLANAGQSCRFVVESLNKS